MATAPPASFRSPFGGLWTDLDDAPQRVRSQLAAGEITEHQAHQLTHWIEHGYLILEHAVPSELVDSLLDEIDQAWRGEIPGLWVEHWDHLTPCFSPASPELREIPHKLHDLYSQSPAARRAIFSPPIHDFLQLVFDRPPMAFQSLTFERGTGQPIHQDTAYVVVSSPLEFAASWIALEDIQPDAGALEYYEGSHRMKDFLFQGKYKNMPPGDPDHQKFLDSLHEQAREMGLPRKKFLPNKGDALLWSADLAHGGSAEITPGTTRRSHVTHYCPNNLAPGYFGSREHSERIPYGDDAYYCHVRWQS